MRGLCVCGQYTDIERKQIKMYLLFTENENKHGCVESGGLARSLEQQGFQLQMVHTYCIQCGSTSSNRACKQSNGGKDPEILELSPNITVGPQNCKQQLRAVYYFTEKDTTRRCSTSKPDVRRVKIGLITLWPSTGAEEPSSDQPTV